MAEIQFDSEAARHRPYLVSIARRMVGHPADAEDVVQDALLKASRGLNSFRGGSTFKTWLTSVTIRTSIDHLRASKRWDNEAMVEACDPAAAPGVRAKFAADPSLNFDVKEHISLCFTCVGRSLPPEQQAALISSEVLGLTDRESADAFELSEPAFRHLLAAARDDMKRQYDGLCALVGKGGACHQCRVLRELAPEARAGAPAPSSLEFADRLALARTHEAAANTLTAYFFDALKALQARRLATQGG